jgi:Domain of unknown function (DUF3331)
MPSSLILGCSRCPRPIDWRANPDAETTDWRARRGKTAHRVRREGTAIAVSYPYPVTGTDPWARTLSALLHFADVPEAFREELASLQLKHLPARRPSYDPDARSFTVNVLECLANGLVVVSWHDPTLCNYEEQVWSAAHARHAGQCALSGERISRGGSVYTPKARGQVQPLNGDAMILASALRRLGDG